jgi:hypothetical protein
MARTYKKSPYKWYKKEKKPYRKEDYRKYRKKTNQMSRQGKEEYPDYTRTSGWLTH